MRKQNKRSENSSGSNNSSNKIVIKNKGKFITFVIAVFVILIAIICIIISTSNIKIDEDTDISNLNADKYSEQIKAEYELEGKDSLFMQNWNDIQDATARYLIENYPADNTQVSKLINEIAEILNSDNWEKLNIEKNTVWNGTWNIDENGRVNFKFSNKEIEPNWANTLSDQGYIVLN